VTTAAAVSATATSFLMVDMSVLLLGATEHGVPSRDASSIRSFVVRAGAIDVSQVTAILEESPR
jgi:hypothetical protein